MPNFLDIRHITLGSATQTGHSVYRRAIYRPDSTRIIYKLNKYNNPKYSRLEVAFNALTELFLKPNLSSPQILVKDNNHNILGVASKHLWYSAIQREDQNTPFYKIKKRNDAEDDLEKSDVLEEDPPIYFLDKFEPGFFSQLCQKERQGILSLDMDSLASVLTTSYTLEEDDLHKGNIAFYLVQKNGKPHVVFQKIDADLMLADSVMSFSGTRLVNLRHGRSAFQITARDLCDFPKLYDSNNHYWPTTKRYLTKPSDNKVYNNSEEIEAFTSLNQRPDFQQAKWRHFYKHIVIPTEMISQAITTAFDPKNPFDRAQIAMITQAVIERQARLRAVLFSIPDFRHYVHTMSAQIQDDLRHEIMLSTTNENREHVSEHLDHTFQHYHQFCANNGIACDDTPLHIAIRMGEYSPIMWKSFKEFAEIENGRGEKPLDVAIQLARHDPNWEQRNTIRSHPGYIISHLLGKGVRKTQAYHLLGKRTKDLVSNYQFPTHHLNDAAKAKNSEGLIRVLRDVGEDCQFTLKMKKKLALSCVQQFIDTNINQNPQQVKLVLTKLKLALNGNGQSSSPRPELQFIRQLRSRLWVVRKIRGLLGGTATQVALTELLDQEIQRLSPSGQGRFSFFSQQNNPVQPDEPNEPYSVTL
jgi:hypothetical protein